MEHFPLPNINKTTRQWEKPSDKTVKVKRERVAVHTGRPLLIGAFNLQPPKSAPARKCPCCGAPMLRIMTIPAAWQSSRAPPPPKKRRVA